MTAPERFKPTAADREKLLAARKALGAVLDAGIVERIDGPHEEDPEWEHSYIGVAYREICDILEREK